jgi:hypothetical protein
VLIFKDYLVFMWYVIFMRNSNSIIFINHLVGFYLYLVKINVLSHYVGVICFMHTTNQYNV